jgi:hypothetical protein
LAKAGSSDTEEPSNIRGPCCIRIHCNGEFSGFSNLTGQGTIGIHGTNDPGSIGHAASHGCIRLANWDVVRLATKIKPGDNVSIH